MTGITPAGGPSPGDDPWPVDAITGAFDPAVQLDLRVARYHAGSIADSLTAIATGTPQTMQDSQIAATILSLFGGVMRVAACPNVAPDHLAGLARCAADLAQSRGDLPATARIGGVAERLLQAADRASGQLDTATSLAFSHATQSAQALRQIAAARWTSLAPLDPPPLTQEALALARDLARPEPGNQNQDPSVALRLQGMAASFLGIAAFVEGGQGHARVVEPLRDVMRVIADAASGGGRFQDTRAANIGGQLIQRIATIRTAIAPHNDLRIDLSSLSRSLEADATLLQSAMATKIGRYERLFEGRS